MSDFQAWNHTIHPIVRLEADWNNLLDHGVAKGVHFIVRVNGGYYECLHGTGTTAGTIAYGGPDNVGGVDGTDGDAVIQAALDNLTAARTHQETVVIQGDITIDAAIEPSSYTKIYLHGSLTLADNSDCSMIYVNDVLYVDIFGGILYGNKANQASGHGLEIYSSVFVEDMGSSFNNMFIYETKEHGVRLHGASREVRLIDITVYTCDGIGISLESGDSKTSMCTVGHAGELGFYVGPEWCHELSNCKSFGNGFGVAPANPDGFLISGNGAVLTNCYAQDNWRHGFLIYSTLPASYGRNNLLVGCSAESNSNGAADGWGLVIDDCEHNTIMGFSSTDRHAGVSRTQVGGIKLSQDADYNRILGGSINNTVTYGLQNNSTQSHNMIRNVEGYINEAVAVATILNGTTSIDVDPDFDTSLDFTVAAPIVTLGPQHSEVLDVIWAVKDADEITLTTQVAVTADRDISYYIVMPEAIRG